MNEQSLLEWLLLDRIELRRLKGFRAIVFSQKDLVDNLQLVKAEPQIFAIKFTKKFSISTN